jgi:transposase
MPKVYSVDLRKSVLRSLDEGQSKSAVHRLLHVSRSTIDHWLALREQTGSVSPRAMRCGGTSSLQGEVFEEFVQRHAHATLGEMAQAWQQQTGLSLTAMSFSRALRRLGWTRKKRVGVTRSATKRRARRS